MSILEAAKTLEKKSSHLDPKSDDYIAEEAMPLNPVKSVHHTEGMYVTLPKKSLNDAKNETKTRDDNTLLNVTDIDNPKAENEGQESKNNVDDAIVGIVDTEDLDVSLNTANLEGMILAELIFKSL